MTDTRRTAGGIDDDIDEHYVAFKFSDWPEQRRRVDPLGCLEEMLGARSVWKGVLIAVRYQYFETLSEEVAQVREDDETLTYELARAVAINGSSRVRKEADLVQRAQQRVYRLEAAIEFWYARQAFERGMPPERALVRQDGPDTQRP